MGGAEGCTSVKPLPAFRGFVGQRKVVAFVLRVMMGARDSGEACPSMLIRGGSGLGKTFLAEKLAAEYGTDFHKIVANKHTDLAAIGVAARAWSANDFVFIDETHTLEPGPQEALYRVLDESVVPAIDDGGKVLKVVGVREAPPITLILATDQAGRLCRALTKRCGLAFTLHPYSVEEMTHIVKQRATKLDILLTPQAARTVAATCQGIPRLARHRLLNLKHYFAPEAVSDLTTEHVRRFLRAGGVDRRGLTMDHLMYLKLVRNLGGEKVSLRSIPAGLQLDQRYIADEVEPLLVREGLAAVGAAGRLLTAKGVAIAEQAPSEAGNG